MGILFISSIKSVPLSAISNLPFLPVLFAPVKAPPSYPNNSDSIRVSGKAVAFILTIRFLLLPLKLCMAWATSSLPVPVSPFIMTVELLFAAVMIFFFTSRIASEPPMILLMEYRESLFSIISFSRFNSS